MRPFIRIRLDWMVCSIVVIKLIGILTGLPFNRKAGTFGLCYMDFMSVALNI